LEEIENMVEKIKDKAWEVMQGSLKNLIVTVVEVAKSVAPEVPKEAVIVESSVDTAGVGVLPKIHLSVRVDMSKL
jgi:hypothetical protein